MSAIYNEVDPVACAVLRHLSNENIIAPGLVVERSIKDIHDLDLIGAVQFHAFAGAGLWSVAARLAGWPDGRALWSGSCPCQGWSTAGKRKGFEDSRDLWPDFFRLIVACRPSVVVGEITSGSAIYPWFDRTASDLESVGYACRAIDLPACAVDAPHRRNRLWWVALADATGSRRSDAQDAGADRVNAGERGAKNKRRPTRGFQSQRNDVDGRTPRRSAGFYESPGHDQRDLADADGGGHRGRPENPQRVAQRRDAAEWTDEPVEHAAGFNRRARTGRRNGSQIIDANGSDLGDPDRWAPGQPSEAAVGHGRASTAADVGFWSDAEWLACADGKARRAKRELCGVVDGLAGESDSGGDTGDRSAQIDYSLLVKGQIGRADLWRLVGNSIVPQLAAEVLRSLKDEIDSRS